MKYPFHFLLLIPILIHSVAGAQSNDEASPNITLEKKFKKIICGAYPCDFESGDTLIRNSKEEIHVVHVIEKSKSECSSFADCQRARANSFEGEWLIRHSPKEAKTSCRKLLGSDSLGSFEDFDDTKPFSLLTEEGKQVLKMQIKNRYDYSGYSFQLDPPELKKLEHKSEPSAGPLDQIYYHYNWDYGLAEGNGARDFEVDSTKKSSSKPFKNSFLSLPIFRSEELLKNGGWKKTPLGACALTLGGISTKGYFLVGDKDMAKDFVAKAALVLEKDPGIIDPRYLLVQVQGEKFVTDSKNWLFDDHLELWLGTQSLDGEISSEKPQQWGIRMADGKVFPAYGNPKKNPKVERAEFSDSNGRKWISMLIDIRALKLPSDLGMTISLSYSKSNEQKAVKYLVSSSQLIFGNTNSLGMGVRIDNEMVHCIASKDGLNSRLIEGESPGGCKSN